MRMSKIGLAPYISSDNFTQNLPNKPVEYLSAGLPVVSSLQGNLQQLLSRHDCGVTYGNRDAGQLARVVADLHDNPGRLAAMSENCRGLYQDQFVAEKVYSEMHAYLAGIVRTHALQQVNGQRRIA